MSGRAVARYVAVGERWYKPGDVPTEEDAKKITNPKAWLAPEDASMVPGPSQVLTPDEVEANRQAVRDHLSSVEDSPAFNPSDHSVDEVKEYLAGLGDDEQLEHQRVLDAEQSGKARKGILEP